MNELIYVTNACSLGFVASLRQGMRPFAVAAPLIAAYLHALARFLAASALDPGRNEVAARSMRARAEMRVKIQTSLKVHDDLLA